MPDAEAPMLDINEIHNNSPKIALNRSQLISKPKI
jgi:hypothetical protein